MGRSVKARFFIMDIRLSLCLDEFLEAGLIVPIDPIRGQFRDLCIHFYIFFKLFPVEAVREPSVLNAYKVILFFELASSLS